MKLAKKIGYKLIVSICLVLTLCTFIASTPVEASKVNKSDFYYSGTQKGSYTVEKGFLEKLIESLAEILDYLLGLCTMGLRMVFIGWTALFERCLTWIFKGASGEEVAVSEVSSTNLIGSDDWITIDSILFNHVPLLDVNVFNFEQIEGYDSTGTEIPEGETPTSVDDDKNLVLILKETIAGWYYAFRLIAIMIMLVLLIYLGVQSAISSAAQVKATYKRMLADWIVGMILVFSMHYIMLGIIQFNEILVKEIANMRKGSTPIAVYEYGLLERVKPLTNDELEFTLYDEVKTRAYDFKMTVGTTGMIMYMALVYYAWKYAFVYLKRYLTVAVLIIIGPIVVVSYAFNKVKSGKVQKSPVFSNWLKEFAFIVMLQSIHALIYTMFVQTALALSLSSISAMILVLLLFNFMFKTEVIFRKIFNINGSLTDDVAKDTNIKDNLAPIKAAIGTMAVGKLAKSYTKGAAKVMTKPIAGVAERAFAETMKQRAKKLDEKAKNYKDLYNSDVKNYSELKNVLKNKRINALKFGNLRKQIEDGEIDLDEFEENVNSLNIGDSLYDENKNMIGIVDQKYIDSKRSELEQLRGIQNWSDEEKEYWMTEYDNLHNNKGNLKKIRIYAGEKWADIFDPKRYTETVTDKDGNTVYKAIATERKYGKYGKKTDSVGKRLAEQLTWDNISQLNKEEKENLKNQYKFAESKIKECAYKLGALITLVPNPSASMLLLAKGIVEGEKANSSDGRKKEKFIRNYKVDSNGKYIFKGFEGKSEYTIAEGTKAMAREQVMDIVIAKDYQEASMKARLEERHKAVAADLKLSANTGEPCKFVHMKNMGIEKSKQFVRKRVLKDPILNSRYGDNLWSAYTDTVMSITKSNAKAIKKAEKQAKTENYLELFADQYLQLEEQQYKKEADRHAKLFGEQYATVLSEMKTKVDEKGEKELLRDTGYEEVIYSTRTSDGKILISKEAENQLIDNILIDYAQKSGLMDVSKINVEEKKEQIVSMLTTELVTRGIINNSETVNDVFQDVGKTIKDRQVKFNVGEEGKRAVESKIAGDAIISIMKEKGITDPTQVSEQEALKRYELAYNKSANSTTETTNVLDKLNAQRGDGTKIASSVDSIVTTTRATQAIQARKSIFSQKSNKTISQTETTAMKEILKHKEQLDLDSTILGIEDELSNGKTESVLEIIANSKGGVNNENDSSVSVNNNASVLKMLELQTQIYKDKKKVEYTQRRRETKEPKIKAIQQPNLDGSRRIMATEIDIGEILRRKKQEISI